MAASAKLGELFVSFVARTGLFDRNVDKSRKKLGTFGKSTAVGRSLMLGFGRAAVTAAGVGGLGYMTNQTLASVDALGKSADKLGITTEKLGAYQHAARLSGVEVRSLGIGIQRMARRVSEAAIGTGEAQQAIQQLGFDAKELNKLRVDQQFEAIGRAINKLQGGERIRVAAKIFDVEAVALVNTFALGLDKAEREYRGLNAQMSRTDVGKVEQLNDEMTRLRATLGAQFAKGLMEVAPALQDAVKGALALNEVLTKGPLAELRRNAVNRLGFAMERTEALVSGRVTTEANLALRGAAAQRAQGPEMRNGQQSAELARRLHEREVRILERMEKQGLDQNGRPMRTTGI